MGIAVRQDKLRADTYMPVPVGPLQLEGLVDDPEIRRAAPVGQLRAPAGSLLASSLPKKLHAIAISLNSPAVKVIRSPS
jgi:hypothetical protein